MTGAGEPELSLSSRFFLWLYRKLQRGWLSLLLLGGVYLVSAGSLEKAHWVPNSDPILTALALGMILGAALAATRWRGWAALVYTLLLGPLLICQAVGQIVPSLDIVFSQSFLGLVDLMNVRLFAFFARTGGWAALYRAGRPSRIPGCSCCWPACWCGWRAPG